MVVLDKEEIDCKVELQKIYCKTHEVPYFCMDGVCPFCNNDIFHDVPEMVCSHVHLTACHSCDRSFVE
jgi:hypothetical protein